MNRILNVTNLEVFGDLGQRVIYIKVNIILSVYFFSFFCYLLIVFCFNVI